MGKFLILFGLIVVSVGLVITLLSRLGVFRLPGDLQFGSKNWRIFIPITSCVVISVILTIILWIINLFRG
ncbi:MAG TPA: DUF2905 domain-containing protein [Planctomycetes bacterium]|nr:DUF2905 domain-containing protein [Planctomycetota bacterium]